MRKSKKQVTKNPDALIGAWFTQNDSFGCPRKGEVKAALPDGHYLLYFPDWEESRVVHVRDFATAGLVWGKPFAFSFFRSESRADAAEAAWKRSEEFIKAKQAA